MSYFFHRRNAMKKVVGFWVTEFDNWLILISSIEPTDIDSMVAGSYTRVPIPGCLVHSSPPSLPPLTPTNTKKQMVTLTADLTPGRWQTSLSSELARGRRIIILCAANTQRICKLFHVIQPDVSLQVSESL